MATSLVSPLSPRTTIDNRTVTGVPETSFFHGTKLSVAPCAANTRSRTARRWRFRSAKSFDHIPEQFRAENLADGLMDNYKNVPKSLFDFTPSDLIVTEDNQLSQMCGSVTEESVSSRCSYASLGRVFPQMPVRKRKPSPNKQNPWTHGIEPPDLASALFDQRVIFLNMPFYPEIAELVTAEFMYMDYTNTTEPIFLLLNSSGCQNNKRQVVALDSEAYCIADTMALCKAKIVTLNLGKALGQAAMLLSLGAKDYRYLNPNCVTSLYMPRTYRTFGSVSDLSHQAEELEVMGDYYVELLAEGIGKPKEVIARDLQRIMHFQPQMAIEYGIADKIKVRGKGMKGKGKEKEKDRDIAEELSEIPGPPQTVP